MDTLRNELIERIEETVETDRSRNIDYNINNIHNVTTRVASIELIQRELPLAEVVVNLDVFYRYKKGNV